MTSSPSAPTPPSKLKTCDVFSVHLPRRLHGIWFRGLTFASWNSVPMGQRLLTLPASLIFPHRRSLLWQVWVITVFPKVPLSFHRPSIHVVRVLSSHVHGFDYHRWHLSKCKLYPVSAFLQILDLYSVVPTHIIEPKAKGKSVIQFLSLFKTLIFCSS